MPHHTKCRRLQNSLNRLRKKLERFGASIGNDDNLFKFQAAFMDITVQLRKLEKEVAEDTWSKVTGHQDENEDWYYLDERGKRVEVDGVRLDC